ncbi:hypothetical protein ASPFODRAFT_35916 [Aspergillus luchuensis CBS 106.47]|uniref:Uncharacterized protein n=1 Tax=Aspergillus luchuensis (strain CBS 106.47) TaxID=1137211 RepID=A0A1M3T9H3_ASPLC|nr:hypothetical protein ASPFODRAFT_35916 [Aspergillus luchuensis CBS 106.47]
MHRWYLSVGNKVTCILGKCQESRQCVWSGDVLVVITSHGDYSSRLYHSFVYLQKRRELRDSDLWGMYGVCWDVTRTIGSGQDKCTQYKCYPINSRWIVIGNSRASVMSSNNDGTSGRQVARDQRSTCPHAQIGPVGNCHGLSIGDADDSASKSDERANERMKE